MKKRLPAAIAAAIAAAAALFYLYMTEEGKGAGIPCPFYLFTGLYCGGCGASRALRSILHLNFIQAFRYNAPFTILFPVAAVYCVLVFLSLLIYGKDKVTAKIPIVIPIVAVLITIIYGILRNIPVFSFLAPTML